MPASDPTIYTVAEVAALLNCHQGNVRRHHHEGTMPRGWKVGNRLVFDRAEVDAWIPNRRKVGHPFVNQPNDGLPPKGSARNRFAADDPMRDWA